MSDTPLVCFDFIVVSLVMLLVLLESLQSKRVHQVDYFIMFQPMVVKLLNMYWEKKNSLKIHLNQIERL